MREMFVALLLLPLLQAQQTPAGKADAGSADTGKAFWQLQSCKNCHGLQGEGGFGPDLAGRRLSLAQFKRALRRPWGVMPQYGEQQVTDQNVADLHAFFSDLPQVAQPGEWHWPHAPEGSPTGQRLQSAFGCGECHEPELAYPRRWLGGVGKDADFAYFSKVIYQHSEKYPKGRMGNFSKERLTEPLLLEIFRFMRDEVGFRVPISTRLTAGAQRGANTTYTLTVLNEGAAGRGLTAENVTIFLKVPSACTVAGGTGTGYKGVRPLAQLGLMPALRLAPHPHDASGRVERPKAELEGDVAVWEVPSVAPGETQIYTLTLSGPGPTAEVLQAFAGSTVYWEKPGVRVPPNLVYRDLRMPDKGDQMAVVPPQPPSP